MSTEVFPVQIFIAYSSKDLVFKDEIRRRLKPLLRARKIDIWDNYDIEAGADWDADIHEKLAKSDIILLLLSPDALDSDYFYEVEAPIALQRHEKGEAIAVGVMLRPCALKHTPFEKLERSELLPKKGIPITDPRWHNADAAYLTIFEEIDLLVEKVEGLRIEKKQRLLRHQEYLLIVEQADNLLKKKKWTEAISLLDSCLALWEDGFEPGREILVSKLDKCGTELEAMETATRTEKEALASITKAKEEMELKKRAEIERLEREAREARQQSEAAEQRRLEQEQISLKELEWLYQQRQSSKKNSQKVIGIDFGNTNTCVAVMDNGKPIVIPNDEGSHTTPSVVAYLINGEIKIGASAKRQAITNPTRTIASIKGLLGKGYREFLLENKPQNYQVIDAGNDHLGIDLGIDIEGQPYSPEKICAAVFQKIKTITELFLGESVSKTVVAVPAYFDDYQRHALKKAGKLAGLDILRMVNEPTLAAMAYGFDKQEEELKILVYDLGGGGFSCSIVETGHGVYEVKATGGEKNVGGEAFDLAIVNFLAELFQKQERIDLRKDGMALQRLKEAAEKSRIELSSSNESEVNLPYIAAFEGVPKHLVLNLTRSKLEQMIAPFIARTMEICSTLLIEAGCTPADLDHVVLIGAASRTPLVQDEIRKLSGKNLRFSINPDEAVALGAAIQGGTMTGEIKDVILLDVSSKSLGIETVGGVYEVIIEKNTSLPVKKSRRYTLIPDKQSQIEINILQGECPMARDNRSLGRLVMKEIRPGPNGQTLVEVTFDIDSNQVLEVSARMVDTDKQHSLRIDFSKREENHASSLGSN